MKLNMNLKATYGIFLKNNIVHYVFVIDKHFSIIYNYRVS